MSNKREKSEPSPVTVAVASILWPGLGYWLIGERRRAVLTGGGIVLLFVLGVLIAGIRVISVPGYEDGYPKYVELTGNQSAFISQQPIVAVRSAGRDASGIERYIVTRKTTQGLKEESTNEPPRIELQLLHSPFAVLTDNLWFLGQMLMGPLCAIAGYLSIHAAQLGIDRSYARLSDVGALYTAVAGMLNLMVIVDATARTLAAMPEERRR